MDTRLFLSRSGHPIYTFTTKSLTISQNKIDLVFLADSLTEDFFNLIANKIDISVREEVNLFTHPLLQTYGSVATFVIDNTETLDDGTVSVTAHILIGDMKDEISKLKDLFLRTTESEYYKSEYANHEECILCFPCSLIRRMVELGVDKKEIKKLIQQVQ